MNKRIIINIEIKDAAATATVVDLIKEYVHNKEWSYDHFLISSFDHAAIMQVYELCPHIKTGALFDEESSNEVAITIKNHAQYVIVDFNSANKKLIEEAHNNGLGIFTYTVNNKHIALQLKEWGIDGIITNYPDILKKHN